MSDELSLSNSTGCLCLVLTCPASGYVYRNSRTAIIGPIRLFSPIISRIFPESFLASSLLTGLAKVRVRHAERGEMNKYRRIEVKAFSRRVTIVSGEWPRGFSPAKPPHAEADVSLDNTNLCEPVEPDSPEGQLILVEAVRSLERRLSPQARATIRAGEHNFANRNLHLGLQSFYRLVWPKALRFSRKEK